MGKIERYRQVLNEFKAICSSGSQTCSLSAYFRYNGLEADCIRIVMKDEYQGANAIPGYRRMSSKRDKRNSEACAKIYEDFKTLCAEGRQPGPFMRYCANFGISRRQMHNHLKYRKLSVMELPGYTHPTKGAGRRYESVPFEDVIFEEAGFLPAAESVITVKVDGKVAVSFPADTDVSVIAKFVKKLGKEVAHVGS